MKINDILFITLLLTVVACKNNTGKDSVEKADSINRARIDSTLDEAKADSATNQVSSSFLVEAADGGMMEVLAGELAKQKAVNQRVKNFGDMMVKDHSKANDELKSLATSEKITIPAAVSDNTQKMIDKLNEKTGTDFDKAYIKMMVDDHIEDVRKFELAATDVNNNTAVKKFINKTLPVLRIHLDSAKAIQQSIKK